MGKNISVDVFSKRSIQAAIKELEKYRDSLEYKARLLAEKLSEKGVEIARVQIADLDAIFTGELLESIHNEYVESFKGGAVFAVVAGTDHAFFVEFGTGQMGKDSPYPYPLPQGISWNYATGKTIRQNAKTGRYYWFYPGRDGLWHYTEGMPARPFMYQTSLELQQIVAEVAKEVFGQ